MPKFRRKTIIDAVQFNGGEQPGELCDAVIAGAVRYTEGGNMEVNTSDGVMVAHPGDWIIKIKGAYYPCKPDVFARAYEPAQPCP